MIPHLCPFELETFKAFFSRIINLLFTKLARDRTGRISALGLFCTDLAALGSYSQDLGPIISRLIRLISSISLMKFASSTLASNLI